MVTISKFFAELGFKVNSSEFKNVESTLKQVNDAYKTLAKQLKLETAELKKNLVAEKLKTQEEKTLTQQSKAAAAALNAETAALRKQTAQINLQNKQNRQRLTLFRRLAPYLSLYAIGSGIKETASEGLRYRDFIRQTGMDVGGLQQYEVASQLTGSSMSQEQVSNEVKELQQRMQSINYARGDVSPYQILGIVPNKNNAYEVIEGLRDRIKSLDDAGALYWIRQIGLSDDWLHILRQSREEFQSLQAAMLSKKQIQSVTNLGLAIRKLFFALKQLRDQTVALFSDSFANILQMISSATTAVAGFLSLMSNSNAAFAVFATGIAGIMAAMRPLLLVFTSLLLILEDLWVYYQGGKSGLPWGALGLDTKEEKKDSSIVKGIKDFVDNTPILSKFKSLATRFMGGDKDYNPVTDLPPNVTSSVSNVGGNVVNQNNTVYVDSAEDAGIFVNNAALNPDYDIIKYNRTMMGLDGGF